MGINSSEIKKISSEQKKISSTLFKISSEIKKTEYSDHAEHSDYNDEFIIKIHDFIEEFDDLSGATQNFLTNNNK